jgi:hypothetical protein
MPKSLPISFRLDEDEKAALEKAAATEARSVSSLLTLIVRDWLRERGYLPSSAS